MNRLWSLIRYRAITTVLPLTLLASLLAPGPLPGQCDQTPDFVVVSVKADSTIDTNDAYHPIHIFASYGYEKSYDSVFSLFRVSDFKHNGQRISLATWCAGKDISGISNSALSDSSVTENFVINTDDTIFFYREFSWTTETDSGKWTDLDYYKSLDTLDYSIELVDLSSGIRLTLLDSIGVLRNMVGSTPNIYGGLPILSNVTYVVPSSLNSKIAFIRVNLYSRGSSGTGFSRTDRWAIGMQKRLSSTYMQYVADYIDTVAVKAAISSRTTTDKSRLRATVTSNGNIEIMFTPSDVAPTSVILFGSDGRAIFSPATLPSGSNPIPTLATYTPEASGVYYAVLLYEGRLITSDKIIITK